ncbi:MAG: NAD(P)/FAD-dependent oxidoreductase [Planctomycetes bacterium]|nr:NAD(P)/FAD-dependent oxidoreductase [Planctomycetota bacterium]
MTAAARSYDVLVIGAGAAGLFCAITAGARGRSVAVLDHAEKLGRKILISGGGRCNFTNRSAGPDNFLSQNPHFCKSALARYRPEDFIALVERHGIAYHEKKLGQLFCDGSAKEIVDLLLSECTDARVEIVPGCRIDRVERVEAGAGFRIATSCGGFTGAKLVIATGGLSIPTIGATDFGYRIARQFGLAIVATEPALVPFTLGEQAGLGELSGVSADATATSGAVSFRENILFTHAGLSGPAILQISSYWNRGQPVDIDLSPERDLAALLDQARGSAPKALLSTHLGAVLPKRLVQRWLQSHDDRPLNQLGPRDLARIAEMFHRWRVVPTGTEGYRKAEVTRGGVDTRELSSQTMEARRAPGLHFIGEVVDVTGWLGGYNFQWAWASGHAAGSAV